MTNEYKCGFALRGDLAEYQFVFAPYADQFQEIARNFGVMRVESSGVQPSNGGKFSYKNVFVFKRLEDQKACEKACEAFLEDDGYYRTAEMNIRILKGKSSATTLSMA